MTTTLDDAGSWDCGGCTACCRHFALGPVSDAIVDGLNARDVGAHWAPAADGFAVRRPGPDGQPAWFFTRREDGACIFLEQDGRCAIHARWGAAAKPAFCREYPFALVQEGPALRVFVRGDCGGWAESFDSGAPIAGQIADIAALDRVHPVGQLRDDPLVILPGLGLTPDAWPTVSAHLLPELGTSRPVLQTLGAACHTLHAIVGREPPESFGPRVPAAVAHAHARLQSALAAALAQPVPPDLPADRAVELTGMRAFLSEVHSLLTDAAPGLPAGPRDTRPPRDLDPGAQDYLALLLRHQAFGLSFQDLGGLPAWLGAMGTGVWIAAAAVPGTAPVTARQLGPRLATWVRLTRHGAVQRLLRDLTPVLEDVFLHAADA